MAVEESEPRDGPIDFSQRLELHLTEIRNSFDAYAAAQQQIIKLLKAIVSDRRAGS